MLNEGNKHEILQAAQEMRHWAESLETLVEMGKRRAVSPRGHRGCGPAAPPARRPA